MMAISFLLVGLVSSPVLFWTCLIVKLRERYFVMYLLLDTEKRRYIIDVSREGTKTAWLLDGKAEPIW